MAEKGLLKSKTFDYKMRNETTTKRKRKRVCACV